MSAMCIGQSQIENIFFFLFPFLFYLFCFHVQTYLVRGLRLQLRGSHIATDRVPATASWCALAANDLVWIPTYRVCVCCSLYGNNEATTRWHTTAAYTLKQVAIQLKNKNKKKLQAKKKIRVHTFDCRVAEQALRMQAERGREHSRSYVHFRVSSSKEERTANLEYIFFVVTTVAANCNWTAVIHRHRMMKFDKKIWPKTVHTICAEYGCHPSSESPLCASEGIENDGMRAETEEYFVNAVWILAACTTRKLCEQKGNNRCWLFSADLVCVCLFAAFITELINYAPFTAKTKANDSDESHEYEAVVAVEREKYHRRQMGKERVWV